MIKTVEIKNFQAHRASSFNFSPGVNVIKGPSHQGKTAVIRAIKWALTNRPAVTSLKSWFSSPKEEIKVAIEFDDGYIIRRKDKEFNGYVLPEEKFDAIGSSVPDEVNAIAKMPDINVQSQHDPYFMIQEGPQNAARKLNEIVGLTIIDEVLANSVRAVQERRKRVAEVEVQIKGYQQEIESYGYLDKLSILMKQIEDNKKILVSVTSRKDALRPLVENIRQYENRHKQLKQQLTVVPKYNQLMSIAEELRQVKGKRYRIKQVCELLSTNKLLLQHVEDGLVPLEDIERLLAINDKFDKIQSERVSLKKLHQSIVDLRNRKMECSMKLRDAEKEHTKMLSDVNICPTCGQIIPDGGKHNHESEKQ
ncbi:MAG: AAA family ATPase [Candidatus Thorarchaeota archaeon]|jgi:exonuclease SbcC